MPARVSARVFVLLITALTIVSGIAADCPQGRGARRDGVSTETGLLKEWPSGGPPLLWKAKGLGAGYSSIAVGGKYIYTIGDGPEASFVHALSRKDGKPHWTAK